MTSLSRVNLWHYTKSMYAGLSKGYDRTEPVPFRSRDRIRAREESFMQDALVVYLTGPGWFGPRVI